MTEINSSKLIQSAAFVRRELAAKNRFEKTNFEPIYLFDTSVIVGNCAPWMSGPWVKTPKGLMGGAGYILRNTEVDHQSEADSIRATRIVEILSEYVLGLTDLILQLPSHHVETNQVYKHVQKRASMSVTKPIDSYKYMSDFDLARRLSVIQNAINGAEDKENSRKLIKKLSEELTGIGIAPHNSVTEYGRYQLLAAKKYGLFEYVHDFGIKVNHALEKLETINDQKNQGLQRRLYSFFESQLSRAKSNRTTISVRTDSKALTQLYLLNNWLVKSDSSHRFVLITSDENLCKSLYNMNASWMPDGALIGFEDFSQKHIRHIRAFVSDALVEKERAMQSTDMFNALLAKWVSANDVEIDKLEKMSTGRMEVEMHSSQQELAKASLDQWDSLTTSAITSASIHDTEISEGLTRILKNRLSDGQKNFHHLARVVGEDVARLRDRAFLTQSDIGFQNILQLKNFSYRRPPELEFSSLTNTSDILRNLYRGIAQTIATDSDFTKVFKSISKDAHNPKIDGDNRQLCYLEYVVMGTAFAAAGKWDIALSHAGRAIDIVQRSLTSIQVLDKDSTFMSGREAYFLKAVSARMLGQLDNAEEALASAINMYSRDRNIGKTKVKGLRFENEKLALCLSRYYKARKNEPMEPKHSEAREVFNALDSLLDALRYKDSKFNYGEKGYVFERGVTNFTRLRVVGNILQCVVISSYRKMNHMRRSSNESISDSIIEYSTEYLENNTNINGNNPDKVEISPIAKAYNLACRIILNKKVKLDLKHDPQDFPEYDSWRFRHLTRFVKDYRHDKWKISSKEELFYWARTSVEGKIIGKSHVSFSSRSECEKNAERNGMNSNPDSLGISDRWEITTEKNKFYWNRFDNGELISRSHRGFKTHLSCVENAKRHGKQDENDDPYKNAHYV